MSPSLVGAGRGRVWTIVVAGGSGVRFGQPKQYEVLGTRRVIDVAVATAARCSEGVVVVVPPADVERERARPTEAAIVVAPGGSTRSASVRAGLAAVPNDAAIICVHDAARPFASETLFARVIGALADGVDGAVPGIAVTDTIKVVDGSRIVVSTPTRESLVAVQTPQAFRAGALRRAHETSSNGTDDASLVEAIGGRVVVVDGEPENRKITHPEDLEWARTRVSAPS